MNYVIINGELYHHGVKGMKWGIRKAKQEYKDAKKAYRIASRGRVSGFGIKGIANATAAEKKANKAFIDMESARAKYKASKAKDSAKAEKAEIKSYAKSMRKHGLVGSDADRQSGGRSTMLYNKLKAEKGKKYADKIQKKVQNRVVAEIATSAAVAVGATVAAAILESRR